MYKKYEAIYMQTYPQNVKELKQVRVKLCEKREQKAHLQLKLLKNPQRFAPWYNQTGITLYVLGMMVSAIGLGFYSNI